MPKVIDPWLLNEDGTEDPFAANVDFTSRQDDLLPEDQITDGDPVLEPVAQVPPVEPVAPPEPPPQPVAPPEPEAPEVLDMEDGTQLILEKDKGQWKGAITNGVGKPQVYWGKTKNELILNVLKAQANATRKIREQNAKLKLGTPAQAPQPTATPNPAKRELSADEVFEIKTLLDSNPALALDTLFQKSTGLSVQQLVDLAKEGRQASIELRADAVNRTFRAQNPDFYPDPDYKNFELMLKWLAKFKLGKIIKDSDVDQTFVELVTSGNYTVESLEEAFQDLSNDGLLIQAPRPPQNLPQQRVEPTSGSPENGQSQQAPPVAVPPEPAPAPRPDSRIVKTVVRPRAATGIRTSDITPVAAPVTPKAPSDEDLDNMTDEEHQNLWNAIRRERLKSRRSI